MDYRSPSVRRVEDTMDHASCTPCDGRFSGSTSVFVSVGYSQVAGRGFCAPPGVCTPGGADVAVAVGGSICAASVVVTAPAAVHISPAHIGVISL